MLRRPLEEVTMRSLLSALVVVQVVGFFVLGSGPVLAQSPTISDHENRITDLENRVTALEGNGNGPNGSFVFVGYSATTFPGGDGIPGLNEQCSEFGPSARVCTTSEFVLSSGTVPPGGVGAWIFPVIVGINSNDFCVDSSGLTRRCGELTCGGWADASRLGIYVTVVGGLGSESCSIPRSVTCCTPAQ